MKKIVIDIIAKNNDIKTFNNRLNKAGLKVLCSLILLSTISTSCTEKPEEEHLKEQEQIGFTINKLEFSEEHNTRAGNSISKEKTTNKDLDTLSEDRVFELKSETDNKEPIFLHAVVSDGISSKVTQEQENSSNNISTRGRPASTDNMYQDAAVFAYTYPKNSSMGVPQTKRYIYDKEVRSSDNWTMNRYRWPGGAYKMAFYLYSPAYIPGFKLTSSKDKKGAPSFEYAVPTIVVNQPDLITTTALDVNGGKNSALPLNFKHILTAVKFEIGGGLQIPGKITKVRLKGISASGSHTIGDNNWNILNYRKDFEVRIPEERNIPNVYGTPITTPEETFMMIPQTLPQGAEIEVEYRDELKGNNNKLVASIAGSTWPMGKTVTYRITSTSVRLEPTLKVEPPVGNFSYTGGTRVYKIESHLKVTHGNKNEYKFIPWQAEFSEDNGNHWSETPPNWITEFTTNNNNGTSDKASYNITVKGQTGRDLNLRNLREEPEKRNWNLSNVSGKDGVQNTANCYLVNAPGSYRIPLVYGNAIKNSLTNEVSFKAREIKYGFLRPFVNHLGHDIVNPYIYNNTGCIPHSCTLIWQDAPNLVTRVHLSSNQRFLEFSVDRASIRQGNAVVAVKDINDVILWSWHIWVTDYVLGYDLKTITNKEGEQHVIMPINLGWCDGEAYEYPERSVKIRIKQKAISDDYPVAESKEFTITQSREVIRTRGNNTYYQWGRKDPFIGAIKVPNGTPLDKVWYDSSGSSHAHWPKSEEYNTQKNIHIINSIKKPKIMNRNISINGSYTNLWNMHNKEESIQNPSIIKTIYDPCPVGYTVPPGNLFTGFSFTGKEALRIEDFNISPESVWNEGWSFYCGLDRTGDKVFFPAMGYRNNNDAKINEIGEIGCYFTASPHRIEEAYNLWFNNEKLNPIRTSKRGHAFSIRPCKEY